MFLPLSLWWLWLMVSQRKRLAFYRSIIAKKGQIQPGISIINPGIYAKYGDHVRKSEALATAFVAANTTIPVPKILDVIEYVGGAIIIMTEVPGEPCRSSIKTWSASELEAMKNTLRNWITQLRELSVPTSAVCGFQGPDDPCRTHRVITDGTCGPFASVRDFHNHLCAIVPPHKQGAIIELAKASHDRSHRIYFTHGDISPNNLLISGNKLVGLIDFETAGWYPEYYEFTMAVYRRQRYIEWFTLFEEVFPEYQIEWKVEMELWAVSHPWV